MTDRYAVVGNPIEHSKSPLIHQMFARQTRQDLRYEAVLAPLDNFAGTTLRLQSEGFKGCNVTVPFKFEACKIAAQLTDRARAAQAVNTLSFLPDGIHGDNTDGAGLVRDIEHNLKYSLDGKRVLILGAGGAAYGVVQPLHLAGALLAIANRTAVKARQLADAFPKAGLQIFQYPELDGLHFDCIINATSSGIKDEMPPLPDSMFHIGLLAYDMMYGRETPFMQKARSKKAIVTDGLGMLVEQAAEAFHLWRGIRPDTQEVITDLRSA